mmetsp:Transcript_80576/g.236793  ORF Transcript_80576/g.236793 Transcript_80576/m.236793 type:complete len:444 (+) Transcript_80576:36-1367(+)
MLILNPALTEDARSLEKVLQSLQSSFLDCALFLACAEAASGGDASKAGLASFVSFLASAFLEAGQEVTTTTGPLQASAEARPGSLESWVALLRSVLEDSGADLDAVYESSEAAADARAAALGEEEDEEDARAPADKDAERWASLTPAQAWAEGEIESLLDRLIAKKTLLELPDMPFRQGTKVFAVLTEDDQWHPAVVQREVRFADMWEGDGPPAAGSCADAGEAEGADASSAARAEPTQTCPPSRQKKSSRRAKAADICTSWFQNRFFEVRFLEFGKMQFARFDKLMLNETVDDDEGVEGMVCEEGECEVCKRSIFLTFHHLIPKATHSRWLRRKKLPEGVRGYESGSRKMLPSSAVKSASSGKTGSAQKKSSAVVKSGKVKSSGAGDENLCTRHFLNTYGIMVCRQCHAQVHHMASNMELAMRYNTLERVLHAPAMERCARF